MIKSITVINHLGESKKFELAFPEKSGFVIQSIEGLGPSKANIITTEVATNDGAIFNSARTNKRNILLHFKFLFSPTIEEVRHQSYKYFPIKQKVELLIETDKRTCKAQGYIESNEPDIFSKEEGTTISIICPDPYLYSQFNTETTFSGLESNFEFPYENNSLSENLTEIGIINRQSIKSVLYEGDSEVGVIIKIHVIGEAEKITIYNTTKREVMIIDTDKLKTLTGAPFAVGEDIIISTIKGDKYARLLRNGEYINILNCINKDANWFQLSKGDNVFAYTAEVGELNLEFKIIHQDIYEGV